MATFQLDDSQSLHRKWLEITKHLFINGCLGFQEVLLNLSQMKTCPARVKLLVLLLRPRTVAKQSHLSDLSTACQGTPQRGARKKTHKNPSKKLIHFNRPQKNARNLEPKKSPTHPKKGPSSSTSGHHWPWGAFTNFTFSHENSAPRRGNSPSPKKNSTKMEQTFEAGGGL